MIVPGIEVAPVANPWRTDHSSMDMLMHMVQLFALNVCCDSRGAVERFLQRSGVVARTTREVLAYRGIGSLLIRLMSMLSKWWSKMDADNVDLGSVAVDGLERIFPISTGVRFHEGYVQENLDAFIGRTCKFLHERVDDEESDRGDTTARHQARIAQECDLLRPDGMAWHLPRDIVEAFETISSSTEGRPRGCRISRPF